MEITEIMAKALQHDVSDILIVAGLPVSYKTSSKITHDEGERLLPSDTQTLLEEIYRLADNRSMDTLLKHGDDDFSFSLPRLSRFRVNALRQRGSLGAVIRVVTFDLPDRHELHIPDAVMKFSAYTKGMVLVTGPAGCGKSTTLACLINAINQQRSAHIITIEDPIEFLHRHNKSVVTQRELSSDTDSYEAALRAALRQAPDVILLGEMRDYDTIKAAITAAETGHLLISTLHTVGAVNTIDRIIDSFPPGQQQQIRVQLGMVLQGVISQQLIPTVDGSALPAFEIMVANNAIRNLIRETKAHQIESVIYSSSSEGMVTMDTYLFNMVKDHLIAPDEAVRYSSNSEQMLKRLAGAGLDK
ncbi:MAG: PilT/PilU family type 4a pilus ATPase [Clostridiales bacterium]|nr:PilT/PilU family type 4a pilus ATPase [Clostridiales bacterium]